MAIINNQDSVTFADGTTMSFPIIAVGNYCVLEFSSSALNAGKTRTITIGSNSVNVTLDSYGNGAVSLMPFMRVDADSNNLQDNPCASTNYWRGSLSVAVSLPDDSDTETTKTVYYILGDYPPRKNAVTDVWRTYNMGMPTNYNVVAVDFVDHYSSGVPVSLLQFRAAWADPSAWVNPPANDDVVSLNVQQVLADKIVTDAVSYHFTTDKRTENVLQVRWIDQQGNLNTRKFTKGTENYGISSSDTYQRPHNSKTITNGTYYFGDDEWRNVKAQRTISFGDDCIPIGQWSWLNSLASSQVVELLDDGLWVRCNIADAGMECDPKKYTFSATFKMTIPTEQNVEM